MNGISVEALYIAVLAGLLGYEIIRRVPPLLHTPLMSATNAISGISLVGSLVAAGSHQGVVSTVLGVIAVTAGAINVVGGIHDYRPHAQDVPAWALASNHEARGR